MPLRARIIENPNVSLNIKHHQTTPPQSHISDITMAARDPITCHVLDTVAGRPAANIAVSLKCTSNNTVFTATTNSDGRVANWTSASGTKVEEVLSVAVESSGGVSTWKLSFETGAYYGEGKTFWPVVDLSFFVKEGEHYHVPLLLGPYSFTTYRGS